MLRLLLTILLIVFASIGYGQIKSIRQVVYFIESYEIKDSTIRILEQFDSKGNLIYEQDFPSDRLWRDRGAWEHEYLYDKDSKIVKHKEFYHRDNGEIVLMNEYFYSYSNPKEPFEANEILVSYNFREDQLELREKIDTITFRSINTEDLFVSNLITWWEFDTVSIAFGSFIFREDFSFNKDLFEANKFESLLKSKSIKEFEKILRSDIEKLSNYLINILESDDSYFCEFEIKSNEMPRSVNFEISENFIEIFYNEFDYQGNKIMTSYYRYYISENELTKNEITKTYFDYY